MALQSKCKSDTSHRCEVHYEFRGCRVKQLDNGNVVLTFDTMQDNRLVDLVVDCMRSSDYNEGEITQVVGCIREVNRMSILRFALVRE